MKSVAKVLCWVGGTLLFLIASGWAVLMLHYSNLPGDWLPDIAAVAYALFAICHGRRHRAEPEDADGARSGCSRWYGPH